MDIAQLLKHGLFIHQTCSPPPHPESSLQLLPQPLPAQHSHMQGSMAVSHAEVTNLSGQIQPSKHTPRDVSSSGPSDGSGEAAESSLPAREGCFLALMFLDRLRQKQPFNVPWPCCSGEGRLLDGGSSWHIPLLMGPSLALFFLIQYLIQCHGFAGIGFHVKQGKRIPFASTELIRTENGDHL